MNVVVWKSNSIVIENDQILGCYLLILGQLKMDFSIWSGNESSRLDVGIWTSYFPAQKCPNTSSEALVRC